MLISQAYKLISKVTWFWWTYHNKYPFVTLLSRHVSSSSLLEDCLAPISMERRKGDWIWMYLTKRSKRKRNGADRHSRRTEFATMRSEISRSAPGSVPAGLRCVAAGLLHRTLNEGLKSLPPCEGLRVALHEPLEALQRDAARRTPSSGHLETKSWAVQPLHSYDLVSFSVFWLIILPPVCSQGSP